MRKRPPLGLRASLAGIALLLLTGGTAPPLPLSAAAYDVMAADVQSLPNGRFRWNDPDPQAGPLGIMVNIPRQHIYVFRAGRLVGLATVSTGRQGHGTPAGEFPILQKQVWHRSNLYSNAPMPYMQRLTWGGIALHAGPLPGRPASHGCIRLPLAFAKLLFGATRVGDRVIISANRLGEPAPQARPEPIVPTVIAAAPPVRPQPASRQQQPVAIAVAYTQAAPRLALDDSILRGSALAEADVSGGLHWGQMRLR